MELTYLITLLLAAVGPLVLAAHPNVGLYRKKSPLLKAVFLPSFFFWAWDIAAIRRGHWSFNPEFVSGLSLFGMPLEEYLFFVTIAFISIFTYEAVKHAALKKPAP